jgi:hypothetical protein
MRTKLQAASLLVVACCILSIPAMAFNVVPITRPSVDNGGCVGADVSATPATVCAGQPVTIGFSLENCGETSDRVVATVLITGPGVGSTYQVVDRIGAGQTKSVSRSMVVPLGAPTGTYIIAVNATSKKGGTGAATTTFDVIQCTSR